MERPLALSRRSFTALAAGAAAASALAPARAQAQGRPVVLELFTSQGCSSSPPADRLLGELSASPGIVALSFHVDYWDYLGWRDTLGSPEGSRRQRDYAQRSGGGHVYTPQMVINGSEQMVGSDRAGLYDAVTRHAARDRSDLVAVSLASGTREISIEVAAAPSQALQQEATIWVATLIPQAVVAIGRGENAGRTVAYTNVVRKLVPAGVWHGKHMVLSLPKPAIMAAGTFCVALLQADGTGPILGASVGVRDAA